jgi:hypothetical protein
VGEERRREGEKERRREGREGRTGQVRGSEQKQTNIDSTTENMGMLNLETYKDK